MMYAFSRDGAVPGSSLWSRVNAKRIPFNAVMAVAVARADPHAARAEGQQGRRHGRLHRGGVDRRDRALRRAGRSRSTCAGARATRSSAGRGTLGEKYKWMAPVALLEILIVVVIYFNLPFSSSGVPWESDFEWSLFNYTPVVTGGLAIAIGLWWFAQREELVHRAQAHDPGDRSRDRAAAAAPRGAVDADGPGHARHARRHRARHGGGAREHPARRRRGGRRRGGAGDGGAAGVARDGARRTARCCCTASSTRSRTHHEELALLEARNAGKPITAARGEIGMAIATFRYYAGAPERLLGDTIPVAGGLALTVREPIGVVGAHHAVELPARDRGLEDGAGPGGRATPWCSSRPSSRR